MGFLRRLFNVRAESEASQNNQTRSEPTASAQPDSSGTLATAKLSPEELAATQRDMSQVMPFAAPPSKHLSYGANSHKGMVRANNQDSLFALLSAQQGAQPMPDFGLFVVADGMGGHEYGERASALAVRVVSQHILQNYYLKRLAEAEDLYIGEILSEALEKANQVVAREAPEGGTTVTVAVVHGTIAYFAHVGDSRAYYITEDGIVQLTKDHSLVQRLVDLDHLTPDEAAVHPQRNVLYRAIGQNENLEVDSFMKPLEDGARLLLCSDGLWNLVDEERIRQVVSSAATPQEACDRLVTLANDKGGNDNITVVLVQLPG
ncbi:MAG: serine/threonine-protein phosphatase [Candidatus Thermofonsia Clade 1 bacterium]|jgi:serine/threonine protein phosphatase PrpC|uniref:Serine/threonine-protein phosphatase n=1 Tax=Candidatus Thermofonsia Clade 1 bacterium TaxID=2364210 RepID=A0A2M8PGW3_9CHLR|nr:MAG: serine/threonine-protein phosphatase [Candidatus Thermofonsia Clade 1 bacterium]RMF51888.1 MAG: Stp1/IreP family PP2C-type Ser/Thr phosphatase [Chloroflexota bacterium]